MKPKILIVEDEVLLAIDLKVQLEKLGYQITATASSSIKAMQFIETEKLDLVLMDIRIKGEVDGIETAQMIKNEHDIPVIFLTAYADDTFLARAKLTEPFGYMLKPVESRELHSTIEMALYKAKLEKERTMLRLELEEALAEIQTLRGILPICSFCKNIRDDKGYWQQIEAYFSRKSDVQFSHGVCPDCIRKEYPELKKLLKKD